MQTEEYESWLKWAADWAAQYHRTIGQRPVRPDIAPEKIAGHIDAVPPETGEAMADIIADFERVIVPGMTHWQHPKFFAYFPANAAPASIVAEMLVSAMAAQCMLWQTSPAATELEIMMVDWLRQALGLSEAFCGVIQDTASNATLAAVLTMRERALGFTGNQNGIKSALEHTGKSTGQLRLYASGEIHSSVERAAWISGIGSDNLVRIPVKGALRSMDAEALEAAINADKNAGHLPAGVIATIGGTGAGACDGLEAIGEIAARHDLYLHVDAAWAGSAMICEEFRSLWAGIEQAHSIVFNPHKWLGAQFDCSVQFLRDPQSHLKTLAIHPEYLKTPGSKSSAQTMPKEILEAGGIVDLCDWGISLGRRFRALKLWFLLRAYGLEDLRCRLRNHVAWSQALAKRFEAEPDFEIASEPILSLFCFRHRPDGNSSDEALDRHNLALCEKINKDGRLYLTHTKLDGKIVIRFQAGQFDCSEEDVMEAFNVITELARQ